MPTRFVVQASSEPRTLPRLLDYFSQLGLVPRRLLSRERGGLLEVAIDVRSMSDRHAMIVAERMRASVGVLTVSLKLPRKESQNASQLFDDAKG
jgi:hypothetical protein